MTVNDPYAVLGIDSSASFEEIVAALERLRAKYQRRADRAREKPQKRAQWLERLEATKTAFKLLCDPRQRQEFAKAAAANEAELQTLRAIALKPTLKALGAVVAVVVAAVIIIVSGTHSNKWLGFIMTLVIIFAIFALAFIPGWAGQAAAAGNEYIKARSSRRGKATTKPDTGDEVAAIATAPMPENPGGEADAGADDDAESTEDGEDAEPGD